MRNDAVGACKVREVVKQQSAEVLDEAAEKRFDTGGRLFWNGNRQAEQGEIRRFIETRAQ